MSALTTESMGSDPFEVLGLSIDATEQAVRARYLELIKLHPPERDADKFRAIQSAYESARDPLVLAKKILETYDSDDCPEWEEVPDRFAKRRPQMTAEFVLSLGNRDQAYRVPEVPKEARSQT